nr:MAG TPA: hypothetical protein [Caudoviricetes sp.]
MREKFDSVRFRHRWCRFGSSRTMGPPWWHWRWYA